MILIGVPESVPIKWPSFKTRYTSKHAHCDPTGLIIPLTGLQGNFIGECVPKDSSGQVSSPKAPVYSYSYSNIGRDRSPPMPPVNGECISQGSRL